jgi:hypothetical protein
VRLVRLAVRYCPGIPTRHEGTLSFRGSGCSSFSNGFTLENKRQVNMRAADLKAQIREIRPHIQRRDRKVFFLVSKQPSWNYSSRKSPSMTSYERLQPRIGWNSRARPLCAQQTRAQARRTGKCRTGSVRVSMFLVDARRPNGLT